MSTGILNPPVGPGNHALGPADAPVTLVEYGDYECPHCGRAHAVLQTVHGIFVNGQRFDGDWSDPVAFATALHQAARPASIR